MRINLFDNNVGQPDDGKYKRNEVTALFPLADKTVVQLCRENENLLIFPYSIEATDDRIGESSVMSIINTDNPDIVRISTGNVMGFIGIDDLRIKIKSRFDKGRDDYLLHYMLQKVLSFNLFDLSHDNEQENVFDFIMFMFPYFFKAAMRQGVYREYRLFKHNDANVKGPIDIGRHIARNVPFVGNIAYSTREYTHDNDMTQLIRHTIEFMKTRKYGLAVLNIDRETKDCVEMIYEHTKTYDRNERSSVVSKNLRLKAHPYYTDYRPLQSLCLQILRMEEVKYGESDDEICGILFDGAWLWEEYVNVILGEHNMGFTHPENKLHRGGIYLFEDRSGVRYPDFYKEDFVLDAKYKRLGGYERVSQVDRNDIHQVITYMNNLNAMKGGFIAPLENKQFIIPSSRLKSSKGMMSIYGIEISKATSSYEVFCNEMKRNEAIFIGALSN